MGKSLSNLMLLVRAGIVMMVALILLGVWRTGHRWNQQLGRFLDVFQWEQPDPQLDSRTIVLQRVQGLSELTTAVLAMESVVPTSRDRTLGEYVIGTTRLLYIAYGEVRAGIDLSLLTADDIRVDEDSIQIQLPPPEILDRKIDVERSQIYDYDRGFLGLGPDAAAELQTLAQRETLDDLVEAACDHDLLQEANARAIAVLSQLLETTNPTAMISIQPQEPDADTCAFQATVG